METTPKNLTDLPDSIIVDILSHLPITDAVRTSVLCWSFRRHWRSIPDLDLSKLRASLASQILLLHSGNIRLLKAAAARGGSDLSNLDYSLAAISDRHAGASLRTLHLVRLDFHLNSISRYFPNLTHLRLAGGSAYIHHDFVGFETLRTLELDNIEFHGDLSLLFSACPLLEGATLKIVTMMERQCLDIIAPKLRVLELSNVCGRDGVSITSAPVLEVVVIDFIAADKGSCEVIMKILGGMPNVKKLKLCTGSISNEFYIPTRLPISFNNLKSLFLSANFEFGSEALFALSLLRSCPNLQELEYKGPFYGKEVFGLGPNFWATQNHEGVIDRLEIFTMTEVLGVRVELDFIHFILSNAQLLKTLMINFNEPKLVTDKELVISQVLKYPVISKEAQILFICKHILATQPQYFIRASVVIPSKFCKFGKIEIEIRRKRRSQ